MSLNDDLKTAEAEVAKIEAEIAALPEVIKGKTESELSEIFHAIRAFFGGKDPEPVAVAMPEVVKADTADNPAV
ncbi:MAG: hypothetical protein Q8924_20045 [Bacillota bacterium]|nr:hypothetical protein [Bacillota bacterium]